uniref:acetylxylan esterase n=1 Tax=Deinococcus alpinitundrae TaxID=468913 RepID=UPI00137A4F07
MQFDFSLAELERYQPAEAAPADFGAFWDATLEETRAFPLNAHFEPVQTLLRSVAVYDLSFSGYAGTTIRGWRLLPAGTRAPLPCVVEYLGYGGGRGLPTDWLLWPSAGYACVVMDTRGQGSAW